MDFFKKPECVPPRKVLKGNQGRTYNPRLESSITSVSPSSSFCYSQQSICSGYSNASDFYKSVIHVRSTVNESKILNNSTELHNSVEKFGQNVWLELLNNSKEWQIGGFIEKNKENKVLAVTSKGNLHKKIMTFEKWWCVLTDEHNLCIQGFVENKNGIVQSEPIIKRMDAHTVASQNSLCKLKNFSGEDCVPGVPYYIKNKFSSGFPEDWKLLRRKWIMFSQAGKQHDFLWEANYVATSLDSRTMPSAPSTQESNCVAYTYKPVVVINKLVQPIPGLSAQSATVEKHFTLNTVRGLHRQEDRTDCNRAERNKPYCAHKQFSNNESLRKSASFIQEPSENSVKERFMWGMQSQDNLLVTHERKTTKVTDIQVDGYNLKSSVPTDTQHNLIGIDDVDGTRHQNFTIVSDNSESEIASDADITTANQRQNSQNVNKDDQPRNKKMQPVVMRKISTTKALMGNEIFLQNWMPILKRRKLYFRGCRSAGDEKESITTVSVKSRQKVDTVKLDNGKICKLVGHLSDVHNCLPAEIRSKFKYGIPSNWRKVLEMWISIEEKSSRRGTRSDTVAEKDNQQPESIKKSSRGRILMQPLKHWLGERPSSMIKHLADDSTKNNNNRQEELVDFRDVQAFPAETILSCASGKKTCVTLNKPAELSQKIVKNAVNSKRKNEYGYRNAKKSKKENMSEPESVRAVNGDDLGDNVCPDSPFENSTNFTVPARRNLRSRKEQVCVQKERSDAILNKKESDGVGKNTGSQRTRSHERINHRKLKHDSTVPNTNKKINVGKESSDAILNENVSDRIGKNTVSQMTRSCGNINKGKLKYGSAESNANQQINTGKESSDAILNENASDGIGKNTGSHWTHSHERINNWKQKSDSTISNTNQQINVGKESVRLNCRKLKQGTTGTDDEGPTSTGNNKCIIKKTKRRNYICRLEMCDVDIDFPDFFGKPPRTLKQRKKLNNIVKTLSQHNKKNVDVFDESSEGHENTRVGWNDFIDLNTAASFNIGEETPSSKLHNGIYAKTPDTSPSTSIFQITPCNKDEVVRYIHQEKTKVDKPAKKKDTKRTKLSFPHTLPVNQAVDVAYAALLKGEPLPKHIISKGMSDDSLSSEFSE